MSTVRVTVLGSGTSVGVPMIGCSCAVCHSPDPRDKRMRPSIVLRYDGRAVLVDASPDLRIQALTYGLTRMDAILFTHSHADHILGLDDIRPFNFLQKEDIPLFGSESTLETVRHTFRYIFDGRETQSTRPQVSTHILRGEPFEVYGLPVQPIPVLHGRDMIFGFRFGGAAYLTDHSQIPESSMAMLQGLEVLFLDALRHKPHPTHSTVDQSLNTAELLGARTTYFTHISHDLAHERTESRLPPSVRLAYDGLEFEVTVP